MAKKSEKVTLGKQYRDRVTGFVGTAVVRYDYFNGRVLYTLAPTVDEEGKLGKHHSVYGNELLSADGSEVEVPKPTKHDIVLGKKYRDRITGFVGTATSRSIHVNGCIQIGLDPPVNEKNEIQAGWMFDDDRIMNIETAEKAVAHPAPRGNANLTSSRL